MNLNSYTFLNTPFLCANKETDLESICVIVSSLKMRYLILISVIAAALLYTPAEAQTCPGGTGSCNCQLNNVDSLRALVRAEVQAQVETEVAARLASTPGNE